MKVRGVLATGTVALLTVAAGCGGGSHGSSATVTKAAWLQKHGAAITGMGTELGLARKALGTGDRQSILGACSLLEDDVAAARRGLPAPNPGVDSALQRAVGVVGTGASDCFRGAQLASVASLNDKAIAELASAQTQVDDLNKALASWP